MTSDNRLFHSWETGNPPTAYGAHAVDAAPKPRCCATDYLIEFSVVMSGAILAGAGGLKFYQLFHGHSPLGLIIPARSIPVLAAAETVLGLYLVLGFCYVWTVLVPSLTLFAVFLGANAYSYVDGNATCSCFGQVPMPIAWAFLIDLFGVVAILSKLGQRRKSLGSGRAPAFAPAIGFAYVAFVGTAAFATSTVFADTRLLAHFHAWVNGDEIVAVPASPNIEAKPAEVVTANVTVINKSHRTIRLLGTEGSCGLSFKTSFPIALGPKSSVSVLITTTAKLTRRKYSLTNNLLTASLKSPSVPVTISISVR